MSAFRAPFGYSFPAAHTEMWLVRHGESVWNAEKRYQGHKDIALNEMGVLQAQRLAARFAAEGVRFDAVYSSDLQRASETARILCPTLDVQMLAGLRELDVGDLTGHKSSEFDRLFPSLGEALARDPLGTKRPNGESVSDLFVRVGQTLRGMAARHPQQKLLVVGHGGTVRAGVCTALGTAEAPLEAGFLWSTLSVSNVSVSRILLPSSEGGRGALLSFNDTAHLGPH